MFTDTNTLVPGSDVYQYKTMLIDNYEHYKKNGCDYRITISTHAVKNYSSKDISFLIFFNTEKPSEHLFHILKQTGIRKGLIGRFCSKGILDIFREYMLYNDMFVYFNPNIEEITFKDYSFNWYDLDVEYKSIIDKYCTKHNLCSLMETGSSGFPMI